MERGDEIARHLRTERILYVIRVILAIGGMLLGLVMVIGAITGKAGSQGGLAVFLLIGLALFGVFAWLLVKAARRHQRPVESHIEEAMVKIRAKETGQEKIKQAAGNSDG